MNQPTIQINHTVKNIKYLNTSCGVAFTASLYENNKKVGMIENAGQGGDTFCRERNNLDENYLNKLLDIAEGVA